MYVAAAQNDCGIQGNADRELLLHPFAVEPKSCLAAMCVSHSLQIELHTASYYYMT